MFKIFKSKYVYLTSLLYILSANILLAQVTNPPGGGPELNNPIGIDSISEFLDAILGLVVRIGGPIITIAIIYTGFLFVSARGSAPKIETAKQALVYVLIGAAIILGAQVLQTVISGTISDITP